MGGPEKIDRQHQRGRLTARERIAALCDPDSFNEIGALAGGQHPGDDPPVPADGLVGGTGRINGRGVVLIAEDFTVIISRTIPIQTQVPIVLDVPIDIALGDTPFGEYLRNLGESLRKR